MMDNDERVIMNNDIDIGGTCYVGEIDADYNDLVKVFGEPDTENICS